MQRTQIYITANQSVKLKEKAKEIGISLAELMRRIFDNYLDNDKNK